MDADGDIDVAMALGMAAPEGAQETHQVAWYENLGRGEKWTKHVVGSLPTADVRDFYVGLLQGSGGTMTQAELLALAANAQANEANIDLTGLQQTGLEFV